MMHAVAGDHLCARMRRIRSRMHAKADVLRVDAQKLLDWRYYVATFPWTSVGLAALIGFWLTPGPRVVATVRLADEALDEVARRTAAQAPHPRATANWLQSLAGLAASLMMKSAMGYLSGRLGAMASSPRPAPSERPRHDSYR